ncbi:MAG: DNA repair protein RadA [Rectinemataceae bacterium]
MKKQNPVYRCSACGHIEPKWLGRCPECGEWNTLREGAAAPPRDSGGESFSLPIRSIDPASGTRISSGSAELDRVLGGGFMRGSAVLLGGEPGIGKSTLLLQVCARLGVAGRVLYVSGEESPAQIRLRADRLGALRESLEVLCTPDLERIRSVLDDVRPVLTVIDSIQTLHAAEAGAVPGTANQIKFCTQELTSWAKAHDSIIVLVAHVTKDGMIAGPKAAEHLVDAVLGFEQAEGELRALRAAKNRFGSTEELGLFRMTATGLAELADPSGIFLVRREGGLPPGVAVAPVHEGSRILLVEIQALTVPAKGGFTRVFSDRIDASRVARIAAVLEKRTGMRFSDQDLYVNVAGGVKLQEPGIDLALACALYSARSGEALPSATALAGELSLAGEVRPVRQMRRRARSAEALGFTRVFGPDDRLPGESADASANLSAVAAATADATANEPAASGSAAAGKGSRTKTKAQEWTRVDDIRTAVRLLWGGQQSRDGTHRDGAQPKAGAQSRDAKEETTA